MNKGREKTKKQNWDGNRQVCLHWGVEEGLQGGSGTVWEHQCHVSHLAQNFITNENQ